MDSRIVGAMLMLGVPAWSQPPVELSAKIGVPISDAFQTGSYHFLATGLHQGDSATRRFTVGAGIVLRLPRGFGAEADVLYKRLGFDVSSSAPAIPVIYEHTWTTANSWEFPLLGVYRAPRRWHVGPRILAGVSFRTVSGESMTGQCVPFSAPYTSFCATTGPTPQPPDGHLEARSSFGGTFGAGIEMRAGPVRLTPEIRYTRWRADAGEGSFPFDLKSNRNQVDFVVGVGF